jgi:glycosyltransferase involved in cell wall biosynthesis
MLDKCRISVAPLRYGSGIKGKLVRSLAFGLPAVASSIGVEGMGLEHEKNVLVADDPRAFAAQVVRLYQDRTLWDRLQEGGYAFVQEKYSRERGREICKRIMDTADQTWLARRRSGRQKRLRQILDEQ